MSLLNRRKFLSSALFATVSALATTAVDYEANTNPQNPEEMGQELLAYLAEQQPGIKAETLAVIAKSFEISQPRSALRPAAAALGGGLLYYFTAGCREKGEDIKMPQKIMNGGGLSIGIDAGGTLLAGGIPPMETIIKKIDALQLPLNGEEIDMIADDIWVYFKKKIYGAASFVPALAASMLTDSIESGLDRLDVNTPKPGP